MARFCRAWKGIPRKVDGSAEPSLNFHGDYRMIREAGLIDILVNNAGLQSDAALDQITLAKWDKVI
jgi:NAD(P)-dependent dehydrogenase (short-subunit alcohol dehydrogenase family)